MSVSIDEDINKSYQKYKFVVKKWEKDFVKQNGRVPSKHDIKEAPQKVRLAYKYYFNLKSQILETSLMDIPLDEGDMTFGEGTSSQDFTFDSFNFDSEDVVPMCNIPSTDDIKMLMNSSTKSYSSDFTQDDTQALVSDKVWGKHLNNKKKDEKPKELIKTSSSSLSAKLFKSCSFNLRNPRKSLPSFKSQSSTESNSQLSKDDDVAKCSSTENVFEKCILDVSSQKPSTLLNPVQCVLQKSVSTVRNINPGWLERCSDTPTSTATPSTPNIAKPSNDSTNQNTNENNANSYGLKNIQVPIDVSKFDDSRLSDFVENSESESDIRNTSYRKIKPIVKKCKLDVTVVKKIDQDNSLSTIEEDSPKKVTRQSTGAKTNTNITKETPADEPKRKKPVRKVSKPVDKNKKAKERPLRKTRKKLEKAMTSESECEEPITTRPKSRRKAKKLSEPTTFDFTDEDCENEYINNFTDEKITYPRFPISSSILKENNLVDSLAAAIETPKKDDKKKEAVNLDTAEEKLRKKIKDGTLNDNFVSINLEKKVYARGKKGINFSKFKKQLWKNKKKMLHSQPEFPTGGILKCFKCGQPGHMSRYCKAGKSGTLLALEHVDNKSEHMSIQQAEEINNKLLVPKVSEIVEFEHINVTNQNTTENVGENGDLSSKGVHKIPESFIKLLASTPVTVKETQPSIQPVYSLLPDNSLPPITDEVTEALHLFGHSSFRNGQETAIMRILSGLSTLVTLSTGSGKSLCYQLPAYIYAKHNKCVTLVISPLVSLMEDQVVNMPGFLQAVCLHTNQSPTQRDKIMQMIKDGQIHILLVSPEAIVAGERTTGFGAVLRQLPPIAFACIDEVHCVSQWSHNFRPSYLMICRVLRDKLNVKCILGLTATATIPTITEIVQHLNIPDGIESVITNKPLPDNLKLTVSRDCQRDSALLQLLKSERFQKCNSVIVYCIRRDECERIASLLRSAMQDCRPTFQEDVKDSKKRKRFNWVVESYHAGMSAAKRKRVQQAFMAGELRIVVATVAFGMGINKSDIRGVIHYNMPSSFESYVQEVGRAGRDGLPAQCHLFIDNKYKDKDELLRHIHANSIERHCIRKLLQKVFLPCGCIKMLETTTDVVSKCEGHEVAFAVEETVTELDIPSENISTLLCYLELHPKKYAKVLSNVYINCKISSYGGVEAIIKAAEKCPPLAMAIALEKKKGNQLAKNGIIEFCVIEVAAAIGWESGVVKYHLKNLEWEKQNGRSKKSLLRVEFNTLGFRVKSPGDLSSTELDTALDSLYHRTQLQEKTSLYQLHEVFKAMASVSFPTIFQCMEDKDQEECEKSSDKLKEMIRNYFSRESSCSEDVEIEERPVNTQQVIGDIRGLLSTYRDCTFTGRAVARILQGISSPNFPAIVWGRCRFWRSHISADFYKLLEIAKEQVILMR